MGENDMYISIMTFVCHLFGNNTKPALGAWLNPFTLILHPQL